MSHIVRHIFEYPHTCLWNTLAASELNTFSHIRNALTGHGIMLVRYLSCFGMQICSIICRFALLFFRLLYLSGTVHFRVLRIGPW